MGQTYGELDLSENPVIVMACSHVLTRESMDGIMEMSATFDLDDEGVATCTAAAVSSKMSAAIAVDRILDAQLPMPACPPACLPSSVPMSASKVWRPPVKQQQALTSTQGTLP